VFAIAITLLVLNLKPTLGAHDMFVIAPLIPNLIGFGLSFYVIGRYWLSHHQLFEAVQSYDRRLLTANLGFLAGVAFLPFPTSVVAEAKAGTGSVVFYLLSLAAVGLLLIMLALVARRPALLRPGETRGGTANMVAAMAAGPVVFIAAAGAAPYDPHLALWLLFLMFPVSWIMDRLGRALQRRIDAAADGED
jgi:uncharacterized membrane protein